MLRAIHAENIPSGIHRRVKTLRGRRIDRALFFPGFTSLGAPSSLASAMHHDPRKPRIQRSSRPFVLFYFYFFHFYEAKLPGRVGRVQVVGTLLYRLPVKKSRRVCSRCAGGTCGAMYVCMTRAGHSDVCVEKASEDLIAMPNRVALPMILHYCAHHRLKHDRWTGVS